MILIQNERGIRMKRRIKSSSHSYKKYIVKYRPGEGWHIFEHSNAVEGPFDTLQQAEDRVDELNAAYSSNL